MISNLFEKSVIFVCIYSRYCVLLYLWIVYLKWFTKRNFVLVEVLDFTMELSEAIKSRCSCFVFCVFFFQWNQYFGIKNCLIFHCFACVIITMFFRPIQVNMNSDCYCYEFLKYFLLFCYCLLNWIYVCVCFFSLDFVWLCCGCVCCLFIFCCFYE